MSSIVSEYDTSDLLNSSFYSSNSTNALEHSRTFRNSLILKEISDRSINASLGQPYTAKDNECESEEQIQSQRAWNPETKTVSIAASPSLSALADILNEKSKNAEQKMKITLATDSIIQEEEESENEENLLGQSNDLSASFPYSRGQSAPSMVASPNLIDLDDSNNFNFVRHDPQIDQPDYLTTPKVQQGATVTAPTNFQLPSELPDISESAAEEGDSYEELPTAIENQAKNKDPVEEASVHQVEFLEEKPKSQSFLLHQTPAFVNPGKIVENTITTYEKNPSVKPNVVSTLNGSATENEIPKPFSVNRSISNDEKHLNRDEVTKRPNMIERRTVSTTPLSSKKATVSSIQDSVKSRNTLSKQPPIQKKKKSIFSFLKKKKHSDTPTGNNSPLATSNTYSQLSHLNPSSGTKPEKLAKKSHSSNSIFDTFRRSKTEPTLNVPKQRVSQHQQNHDSAAITNKRNSHDTSDSSEQPMMKRNPTPLNFNTLLNLEATPSSMDGSTNTVDIAMEKLSPTSVHDEPRRRDSGEAVFPKSLDEDEIDSILKIERNRSIRSNTNRLSIDTLSIKAQNDGMVIEEASDVILSAPDLTKSPTSSILKSGRFESVDTLNTTAPTDNFGSIHANDFSLADVEQELNQLTLDFDDEGPYVNDDTVINPFKGLSGSEKQEEIVVTNNDTDNIGFTEDRELITDIMEFANIIDFGDEVNFDLAFDDEQEQVKSPDFKTFNPAVMDIKPNKIAQEDLPSQDMELRNEYNDADVLDEYEDDCNNVNHNDEDFENEDFNNIVEETEEDQPSQMPFLPSTSPDTGRPISMSFRGLKVPAAGDASAYSPSNTEITSIESYTSGIPYTEKVTRPTVSFSAKIILYDTYSETEYDRHPDIGTCNQLTPQLAQMIKAELNELKETMEVHEDSTCYTQFF
ncbi:hypothetical protein KAFR_0A08000 [Kazachstania africana CBS 2517]|uniref:Protein BNI4 n=1 Tax=Kazachstania africana (strain ATCC 22294 / BCRC 22015 / CBS 2517 / CECT 1963 / NBRC 1671 / NRRL Y-8276) TaxID=1071382 RepID=H2APD4_KAZAF|nr:hypothetical protein KAFR_0A08000 [Kazachstania africana CBS 2517]CCF56234.1 hypothetical protein KAFR_0A08000 [Kazachstania africana CBS 2517]